MYILLYYEEEKMTSTYLKLLTTATTKFCFFCDEELDYSFRLM